MLSSGENGGWRNNSIWQREYRAIWMKKSRNIGMLCLTDGITLCLAYTKELHNKTNRQKI